MKLATFTHGGETRIGAVVGELVVDLSKAAPELPTNMRDFLVAVSYTHLQLPTILLV